MTRTFGYLLASADRRVESPKVQQAVIERYCGQIGRQINGLFADKADAGNLPLFDREGGRQLLDRLRRGDHLVVARLDRLAESSLRIAQILDQLRQFGVVAHLADMPGGVLDPGDPSCKLTVNVLLSAAKQERRSLGMRTRQALANLKAEGRRYCRFAPFGFKWQRQGKKTVMVPDAREQKICIKVAELRVGGYSIDQIRQYLAYEWRIRNRSGNEFGNSDVHNMSLRGAQWLQAAASQGA